MSYLSDSKLDKAYEPHSITHKLETECSTNDSFIATVETILSKSSCLVTIATSEIFEQKFKIIENYKKYRKQFKIFTCKI